MTQAEEQAPMLVRTLPTLRATDGQVAGGKGANLGELINGGFPVPDGFVLTTDAYQLAAVAAGVDSADPDGSAERLRAGPLPDVVRSAALDAYRALGGGAVAIRSSATAEDLPGASFAGQQDTYLGVAGEDEFVDAIRRCWASLWNERAVAYRTDRGIDQRTVALAVVVQLMIDAVAAGVLFTADPITGRRDRSVVDAARGLGDAVVSGTVDPDHYLADATSGEILERSTRGSAAVLDDARIRELATMGRRIERHFDQPQDIEFAFDRDRLWIVQSRPITTLYPLPDDAADTDDLRVYFSASVAQGYFAPITPMGMEPFRAIGARVGRAFDGPDGAGPTRSPLVVAGGRPFVDVTPAIRDPVGREILQRLSAAGEARSSVVFGKLALDPRLSARGRSRLGTIRRLGPILLRSGIPLYVVRLLMSPARTRARIVRDIERATAIDLSPTATSTDRLDAVERLVTDGPPAVFPRMLGVVASGFLPYLAIGRLLGDRATEAELQTLTRGLSHNPTTRMDLELWALAVGLRAESVSREALLGSSTAELTDRWRAGTLPSALQDGLAAFLDRYGFRCVGEIDLGVARWSEDPGHLLGAIANYLQLEDAALAPDAQFERGAREATAMVAALLGRVRGPRSLLLRFFLSRQQALMGSRELPKYTLIRRLFTPVRELLKPVGVELAGAGRLEAPDDIYFLTLAEARQAVSGADLRDAVAERRATHVRELTRRHIPRVLLSDGTDAEVALVDVPDGALRGSPASPGTVTARARVILTPHGARLEPGEILVAPSTDPGWTPLFLTAGGLVMEMGGMMSHGAVVAREYGIPAVVGVPGATDRIRTSDEITVDGSAGVVTLVDAAPYAAGRTGTRS
jgi:rifampicin phosphotransferase